MNETTTFHIPMTIETEGLPAFLDALTGNDKDIVLRAEKAMREHIKDGSLELGHPVPELPTNAVGVNMADVNWLAEPGTPRQLHVIGPYAFVEYVPKRMHPTTEEEHAARLAQHPTNFSCWVDGKRSHRGYSTLEAAIVGTIAIRFDGLNTQADIFFGRMVGLDQES